MSLTTVQAALRNRFMEEWDRDAILTLFDNGGAAKPDPKKPYCRFAIRITDELRHSVGPNGLFRCIGSVWLQVFVPVQDGTTNATQIVDRFANLYRDYSRDRVRTYYPQVDYPGETNGFYQINVIVPFEAIYRANP